ncbi:MAG TPA: hypothetical protein PLD47_07235 [Aggregatilineales bacterium]|nr:hypothetical protein [Anaerolineales bacterium]HRE47502.1 hypothetical protein [Aggregatilineales bacterium]
MDDPSPPQTPKVVAGTPYHQPTHTSEMETRPLKAEALAREVRLIDVEPLPGGDESDIILQEDDQAAPQAELEDLLRLSEPRPEADDTGKYLPTERLRKPESPLKARVRTLTEGIATHPDAPANYVIRGELLLEAGDDEAAAADFTNALTRIEKAEKSLNWGYIYQHLAERAAAGLREIAYGQQRSNRTTKAKR